MPNKLEFATENETVAKNPLKAFVSLFPGGASLARLFSNFRRGHKLKKIGNTEDRFTYIFKHNKWKDPESVSGTGSSLAVTENIRDEIPSLLRELGATSMLDAPCGDFNWFRSIDRTGFSYVGGDIVKVLVDNNTEQYGDDKTRFMHLDIAQDELPDADLWMCRDCFIHLSFDLIRDALANFRRSNIRYLLLSNYPDVTENHDIPTGHARLLNMRLPPFNLPEPLTVIDDTANNEQPKQLVLWERSQVPGH